MLRLLLPVVLVVASLAGCIASDGDFDDHHEDDDHHADDGHPHTPSEGNVAYTGDEDVLVTIVAGDPDEFRFVPQNITVHEGQSVGVTFRNDGEAPHELSINDYGFHLHLDPGEEDQAGFIADEEGTFTFGCYIPGHFEAGMKGTLTVEHAE